MLLQQNSGVYSILPCILFLLIFVVRILSLNNMAAEFFVNYAHKSTWLHLLTFISYLVFQPRPTMTSSLGTRKLYQEPTDFSCNGIVFQCLKEQEGRGGTSQSCSYWDQSLSKIKFEHLRVKSRLNKFFPFLQRRW